MKKCIFFLSLTLISFPAFAQKGAVKGMITNSYRFPVKGAETFIYAADSSIIGSGYTDSTGYFETNRVPAGVYTVKVTYPSIRKAITISGVEIKAEKSTDLNLKLDPPASDTSMGYTDVMPKVIEKKVKIRRKK